MAPAQRPVDVDLLAAGAGLLGLSAARDARGCPAPLEERQNALHGPSAAVSEDMGCQVVGERLDGRLQEHRRAVRMRARAAALDVLRDLLQCLQGGRSAAVEDVLHPARGGGQPEVAGAALAGALLGQPLRHPQRLAQRAGLLADRQDRARTQRTAHRVQGVARDDRLVDRRRVDPLAVVAAGQHALRHRRGARQLEHVAQRHTRGDLQHHRAGHRAGHREHDGARLVVQAGVAVALGADAGGDGQLGERLGVRQQRGRAADAALRGADLAAGRDRGASVDRADQRGGGAGDHAHRVALHPRA